MEEADVDTLTDEEIYDLNNVTIEEFTYVFYDNI